MKVLTRFAQMERWGVPPEIEIGVGTMADYDWLSVYHYVPARPATVCRVLAARGAGDEGGPVGVLVVSYPALNAPWRGEIWGRGMAAGSPRERAARANAMVRTISRVVVDPRWRGIGIARRLICAYLDRPLTPCTEAIAAMGPVCGCFTAAGMRAHALSPGAHDSRLLEALRRRGLLAHELLDPRVLRTLDPRALRRWARASSAHRALASGDVRELARRAARALSSSRFVYTAGP